MFHHKRSILLGVSLVASFACNTTGRRLDKSFLAESEIGSQKCVYFDEDRFVPQDDITTLRGAEGSKYLKDYPGSLPAEYLTYLGSKSKKDTLSMFRALEGQTLRWQWLYNEKLGSKMRKHLGIDSNDVTLDLVSYTLDQRDHQVVLLLVEGKLRVLAQKDDNVLAACDQPIETSAEPKPIAPVKEESGVNQSQKLTCKSLIAAINKGSIVPRKRSASDAAFIEIIKKTVLIHNGENLGRTEKAQLKRATSIAEIESIELLGGLDPFGNDVEINGKLYQFVNIGLGGNSFWSFFKGGSTEHAGFDIVDGDIYFGSTFCEVPESFDPFHSFKFK